MLLRIAQHTEVDADRTRDEVAVTITARTAIYRPSVLKSACLVTYPTANGISKAISTIPNAAFLGRLSAMFGLAANVSGTATRLYKGSS